MPAIRNNELYFIKYKIKKGWPDHLAALATRSTLSLWLMA